MKSRAKIEEQKNNTDCDDGDEGSTDDSCTGAPFDAEMLEVLLEKSDSEAISPLDHMDSDADVHVPDDFLKDEDCPVEKMAQLLEREPPKKRKNLIRDLVERPNENTIKDESLRDFVKMSYTDLQEKNGEKALDKLEAEKQSVIRYWNNKIKAADLEVQYWRNRKESVLNEASWQRKNN